MAGSPNLPILSPVVLNGIIENREPAGELLLTSTFIGGAVVPSPEATWEYDVIEDVREVARFNTPNSEAQIVQQHGVGKKYGGFAYVREKKVFSPTTTMWLRRVGELRAERNAEIAILREIETENRRVDRLVEYSISRLLQGSLNMAPLGNVDVTIDYGIPASHDITVSKSWSDPTADIETDLRVAKRVGTRDSHQMITAWMNDVTANNIMQNYNLRDLIPDELKRQFFETGFIGRFLGFNWINYDLGYIDDWTDPTTPVFVPYIPDNMVILHAENIGQEAWELKEGPSADFSAPTGHIGRFAKTFQEEDPSVRQYLVEYTFMPVLKKPNALIILRV